MKLKKETIETIKEAVMAWGICLLGFALFILAALLS